MILSPNVRALLDQQSAQIRDVLDGMIETVREMLADGCEPDAVAQFLAQAVRQEPERACVALGYALVRLAAPAGDLIDLGGPS